MSRMLLNLDAVTGLMPPRRHSGMKPGTRHRWTASCTALAVAALVCGPSPVMAQVALGTAQPFGVLAASTVTNIGPTTIKGSLGLFPGTESTGRETITLVGSESEVHQTDAVARQAQIDATAAFNDFAGSTIDLSGNNLGGMTLTPGMYSFTSSAQLTGNLFLNCLGNSDALFVFKIGTALTTASGSSVTSINGGPGANVFFLVGSSATLGTTTAFQGTIIADQSVALQTGASILCGRAIALHGAVTLDSNVISTDCLGVGVTPIPEPSTLALLLGPGILGLMGVVQRRRRSVAELV